MFCAWNRVSTARRLGHHETPNAAVTSFRAAPSPMRSRFLTCTRGLVAAVATVWLAVPASAQAVLETFEAAATSWQVTADASGGGAVARSTVRAATGAASARLSTAAAGARAAIRTNFTDAGPAHVWEERPGTYRWQRARLYLPGATVAALGAADAITIGRFWASGQTGTTWAVRVRQGGALSVIGTRDSDGALIEFPVYAAFPVDQWVEFEIGLHSQLGPGVKRALAFVVNGQVHGWYHQGRMQNETYDRSAIGLVDVTSAAALEAFVDDWGEAGASAFPTGADLRSTAALQEQDYRTQNGAGWQIDWTTWANDLRMDPVHGLYSNASRLQSGRNIDRMPSLVSGWAEIEIGWPQGTPPTAPTGYFGPMVGFRKEINREENLEIIPIGRGNGNVDLVLEAWNERELILAQWQLPAATVNGQTTRIPQAGDIIRARWEQVGATSLAVRASYYDGSAATWHTDIIAVTITLNNLHGVNFTDGFHTASSITTDSTAYGIRRFRVGTLATYPSGPSCGYAVAPGSVPLGAGGGSGTIAVTTAAGCPWTATSTASWLSTTGAASGLGSGAVSWSASANPSAAQRSASIAIAGQSVVFTQAPGAAAAQPTLSVGDVVVAEHASDTVAVVFPVWLSTPAPAPVTVQYATASGTAIAGSDFVVTTGTLTFPPGSTTQTVAVDVLHGAVGEGTETFELRLSGAVNAAIADGIGVATIVEPGIAVVEPPSGLAVTAIAAGRVTLQWDAPVAGPAPTGYLLSGGTRPGETIAALPVDAAHRLTSITLPPGLYYARLQTLAGAAASVVSNEVRIPIGLDSPPSAPSGVVGLVDGATVALAWRTTFAGGTPAGAVLDVGGSAALSLPLGPAETFMFAGVPAGTYTFAVRTVSASGSSPPSPPLALTFPGACSGSPATPARLIAHRDGRALVVLWEPAAVGPAPTGYLLQVSGTLTAQVPTPQRSVGGSVGPGVYDLRVVAVNPCGASPPTAIQTVVVP